MTENTFPPLIGLIGKKGSGKDTFAGFLRAHGGYARVAFADPLKEVALGIDPWVGAVGQPAERLSSIVNSVGWDSAKALPEVRHLLQNLGVAIRNLDAGFWLGRGMATASAYRKDQGRPTVFTDVRFKNEAKAIERAGGRLIRVVRPGIDSTDSHVSETELDDYPVSFVVRNTTDLTMLDMHAQVLVGLLVWEGAA